MVPLGGSKNDKKVIITFEENIQKLNCLNDLFKFFIKSLCGFFNSFFRIINFLPIHL